MRRRGKKHWDGTGGQEEHALGRSRGGFGTKLQGGFNGLGQPVERVLTPGQASDIGQAETLLADHAPEVVIADRGYDKKGLAEVIRPGAGRPSSQRNRAERRDIDPLLYRERNVCERFWAQAKQYRRVAIRYEKKAANYLAFAWVVAMMVILK